jgi:hypothetical protein
MNRMLRIVLCFALAGLAGATNVEIIKTANIKVTQ